MNEPYDLSLPDFPSEFEKRMEMIENFKLPPDIKRVCQSMCASNNRILKDLFRSEINGSFLIRIKSGVLNAVLPILPDIFDLKYSDERMMTAGDNAIEYEICRHVIGVHNSNTVFLSAEEKRSWEKDDEYQARLVSQVAQDVIIRLYGSAYFRKKAIISGERFLFYPVPYDIFVLCMKTNEILIREGGKCESAPLISLIINKAMAALSLLEDNFLDCAYMPCRTVIEMYVKLMFLRRQEGLFALSAQFATFDIDKSCCSQEYSDSFNALYARRKNPSATNKIEFLHYGFVDVVDDYHEIVKQQPYSVGGIIKYLISKSDEETSVFFKELEALYKMCHGYTHGNVVKTVYPHLHYFEISLILGGIVPKVFKMLCDDYGIEATLNDIDILEKFNEDFALLQEQYSKRSTENFELELAKRIQR